MTYSDIFEDKSFSLDNNTRLNKSNNTKLNNDSMYSQQERKDAAIQFAQNSNYSIDSIKDKVRDFFSSKEKREERAENRRIRNKFVAKGRRNHTIGKTAATVVGGGVGYAAGNYYATEKLAPKIKALEAIENKTDAQEKQLKSLKLASTASKVGGTAVGMLIGNKAVGKFDRRSREDKAAEYIIKLRSKKRK